MKINRREFLSSTVKSTLGLGTLTMLPSSIQKALAIPANNKTGTIQDVEHVVILMQENRSFDHYFGTRKGVRGFSDRFPIPSSRGTGNVFTQSYNPNKIAKNLINQITNKDARSLVNRLAGIIPDYNVCNIAPVYLDSSKMNAQKPWGLPHSWADSMAAWDHGRMTNWPSSKLLPHSMGYLREKEIPFHSALADAFTLCDAYHCSIQGGTSPNRSFFLTGTNGATANSTAFVVNQWDAIPKDYKTETVSGVKKSKHGYEWKTYAEALEENGISWKSYQNMPDEWGDNMLGAFKSFLNENLKIDAENPNQKLKVHSSSNSVNNESELLTPYDEKFNAKYPLYKGIANTMPGKNPDEYIESFRKDIREGKLPQVSWVNAPAKYSEHPGPSSPIQGGWFIQEILNALTENPDIWSKTAFFVMYDENDGYFDHVPPPAPPSYNESSNSYAGKSTLSQSDMSYEYYTHPLQLNAQSNADVIDFKGQPYGPGPRVPCFVISPWSRGGIVNSQVFDHTSMLMFLEKKFGVKAENISPFRRAICGDLTSAFNFKSPNASRVKPYSASPPRLETDQIVRDQQTLMIFPLNTISENLLNNSTRIPVQDSGISSSSSLPYELHTSGKRKNKENFELLFSNTGTQGAVFHVYDQNNLTAIPRRYVVEAGKQINDVWINKDGKFDLWVLGPNGFHRHFIDHFSESEGGKIAAEIRVCYDIKNEEILLELINNGSFDLKFDIKSNQYILFEIKNVEVAAGKSFHLTPFKVSEYYNWYDFTVGLTDSPNFRRRFAGRIETGRVLCTDPALVIASNAQNTATNQTIYSGKDIERSKIENGCAVNS